MVTKQTILDNVEQYTAEKLVDYIMQGIVTRKELIHDTNGELDSQKRRKIEELLKDCPDPDDAAFERVKSARTIEACQSYLDNFPSGNHRDEVRKFIEQIGEDEELRTEWESVDKDDEESLRKFIDNFPGCGYAEEAGRCLDKIRRKGERGEIVSELLVDRIHELQAQGKLPEEISSEIAEVIRSGEISKNDLLNTLSEDHNFLSSYTVRDLIQKQRIISIEDLYSIGIERVFIKKMLDKVELFHINSATKKFDNITRQSTEIYFWGMPSSGKSCALGAILSVADNGNIAIMEQDPKAQGYGYMNQLMSFFENGKVGPLVRRTNIDSFYEMGFSLVEKDGKKEHPITCIDMAGELMKCLYKKNAGMDMNEMENEMLETLSRILIDHSSSNRKIHFFVVEYGADDRLSDNLTQKIYLTGATSYLKSLNVFEKCTDAIYVIITKVDRAKKEDQTPEALRKYIEDKYSGFYNNLKLICIDNEINGKHLELAAFTLGDVCFQDFCRFRDVAAKNIVKIIMERSASFGRGKWARILRGIKD